MHAYRSSSLRSSTLTERKPEPTGVVVGPLMPTPLCLSDASVSSGNGLPWRSYSSTPASRRSQRNSTPVASSTRRVASASSGPVPSPGMKVTLCVKTVLSISVERRIVPRAGAPTPSAAVFGGNSIQLARVFGIRFGVDVSWFFVLFLIIWQLSAYFGDLFPGQDTKAFVLAVISALAFFLAILLH